MMQVKRPQVHVVIVNWNGREHLETCLPSVFSSQYDNLSVVILDNGSQDESCTWVRDHFPQVRVVSLGRNLGFAKANNVGLQMAMDAGVDYVALLNTDTRVEANWLPALVEVGGSDPRVAICQARQRTWDGLRDIRFRFIPEWAEAEADYVPISPAGDARPSTFASGCAMLLRCAALRRIGLFDERYFMYVEDVDLSLRAWISGYKVMDVPSAIVYHRMAGSSSRPGQRMFWGYRNQLTTLLKLYQTETLRRFVHPIARRWFWTRNRIAWRGTLAALASLPGTLAMRRQVQRSRVVADTCFLELCGE